MDGEPRTRRPVLLLLAVAALLVGLAVYGAVAFFGDDDDDPRPPASGPRPTSALSSTVPGAGATTTVPSPADPLTTEPAPAVEPPGTFPGPTPGLPGPDSEACAMFRELLEMVDDPALRSAAAQVGCI